MAEDQLNLQSESRAASILNNELTRSSPCETSSSLSLKRSASPTFGLEEISSRKRFKESEGQTDDDNGATTESKLADDLSQELGCGCCSELVYNPVVVLPCQHVFCGR